MNTRARELKEKAKAPLAPARAWRHVLAGAPPWCASSSRAVGATRRSSVSRSDCSREGGPCVMCVKEERRGGGYLEDLRNPQTLKPSPPPRRCTAGRELHRPRGEYGGFGYSL